jgi:hypothetical protein
VHALTRRGRIAPLASVALVVASGAACNSLLGNSEHDVAAEASAAMDAGDAIPTEAGDAIHAEAGDGSGDAPDAAVDTAVFDSHPFAEPDAPTLRDTGSAGMDTGSPGTLRFVQALTAASVMGQDSLTTTLPSVGAGDLLVVGAYWVAAATSVKVMDSAGNEWLSVPAAQNPPCVTDMPWTAQIWYAPNAIGGGDTITLTTLGATNDLGFLAVEYSGVAAVNPLDTSVGSSGAAEGPMVSSGPLPTTAPLDLVVGLFGDLNGTGTIKPGSGYTARANDVTFYTMVEDDLPGTAQGMSDPSATVVNADKCWIAIAASFKAR